MEPVYKMWTSWIFNGLSFTGLVLQASKKTWYCRIDIYR